MLRTLYGIVLSALVGGTLLFLLPLFAVVAKDQIAEYWPLVAWCIGMSLVGFSFLNMAAFFSRLKRSDPDRYLLATRGAGFLGYVGQAGRSALSALHDQVAQIAADQSGTFSKDVLVHARISRYMNVVSFLYLIAGLLYLLGLAVYLRFT